MMPRTWPILVFIQVSILTLISAGPVSRNALIVVGNFSIGAEKLNIAEYDLSSGSWEIAHEYQLFRYSQEDAVVYDIAVNYSSTEARDSIFFAGLFDSTSHVSQTQLCSVCRYDGTFFEKIGEGVCSRGDTSSTAVESIELGSEGDLFVSGSFATRLWDGRHFVYAYNIARFDARLSAWLPLSGSGELFDHQFSSRVNSLAWNPDDNVLYIGGRFTRVDERDLTFGLAAWSTRDGIHGFPGGGIDLNEESLRGQEISALQYVSSLRKLFVAGRFSMLGGKPCSNIAVWDNARNDWKCLFDSNFEFDSITSIAVNGHYIFLGGVASKTSSWFPLQGKFSNTVAFLDITRLSVENSSVLLNSHIITDEMSTLGWKWLIDFRGVDGELQRIYVGIDSWEQSLFLIHYNKSASESAILLWTPTHEFRGANTSVIGGAQSRLFGQVTAVGMIRNRNSNNLPPPSPTHVPNDDYTFLILLSCVILGILLGLVFTVGCFYKQSESGFGNWPSKSTRSPPIGIPLKTLSDGYGTTVDFKECFERAMKTRHLSTYETLIIINPKEIMLSRIIGEGSFGRVWSGHWRNNAVAVKEFVFAQAAIVGGSLQRTSIVEEIVGEAGVMACLRHPKILQLYGCSITMQAIWIVSELCIRGSLKMVLMDSHCLLNVQQSLSILIDIADGMQYLHARLPPIIHRDLKSHNIFVTETVPGRYLAKIGDWGSARAVQMSGSRSMTQGVGTACWLSPEVINSAHFSKASDVYAFGIILWEVYTRQELYEGLSAAQIIAKVANEGLRPNIPRDCPWSKVMTQCWRQDPAQRPTFESILSSLSRLYQKNATILNHPGRDYQHES